MDVYVYVYTHSLHVLPAVCMSIHIYAISKAAGAESACLQVWAYANLGYDPGALLEAIAQASEHRMREFSPQNISNILWAYAKLGKLQLILVFVCGQTQIIPNSLCEA